MFCTARQLNIDLSNIHSLEDDLFPWFEEQLAHYPGINKVNISARSLLSSHLPRFVNECKDRKLETFLCSNASILKEVELDRLSAAPLDLLGFWLESLVPATQEKIRPGEHLEDILTCFEALKSRGTQTTCAIYTHILKQNQDEILRILEYVKVQQRIDKLLLHWYGTQTPQRIRQFRDLQKKFGGKPILKDSFYLFDRLQLLAKKEDVLINHFTQIRFWKSTLGKIQNKTQRSLSAKKRLENIREVLSAVPCFQHQPVQYFLQGSSYYHCEEKNPENLSFSHPDFEGVEKEIEGCDLDCHFKINQAHQAQAEAGEGEQFPIPRLFGFGTK